MSVMRTNQAGGTPLSESALELLYTREDGFISEISVEGRLAECLALRATWISSGLSPIRIASAGGGDLYRMTGTISSEDGSTPSTPDSLIKTVWECVGEDRERDLWDKPEVKTALAEIRTYWEGTGQTYKYDLAVQGQVYVRSMVEAMLAGQTEMVIADPSGTEETKKLKVQSIIEVANTWKMLNSSNQAVIRLLIESLSRGTTAYPISGYVLRRTKTGPLASSLRGVRTNVNRMYTTAKLTTDESVPSNLLDEIPSGYWLKRSPTAKQEDNRLVVIQEWVWTDEYDRFALGAPIE